MSPRKSITIAAASDLHGDWESLVCAPADVLILAGDVLSDHSNVPAMNAKLQLGELAELDSFVGKLIDGGVYRRVVYVSGNHEHCLQLCPRDAKRTLSRVDYLQDAALTFLGVRFYGSPWQPWCGDLAFNFSKKEGTAARQAKRRWGAIPDATQVLVTHTPPRGVLDRLAAGEEVGCPFLAERVSSLDCLRLHVFGHIHPSTGCARVGPGGRILAANVASPGRNRRVVRFRLPADPEQPAQLLEE